MLLLKSSYHQIRSQPGIITIPFIGKEARALLAQILQVLTPLEQVHVKVLFQPSGKSLELQDYFAVEPLRQFWSHYENSWLTKIIEEDKLFAVFQPIIAAHSGEVFAYECLLRAHRADQVMLPGQLFQIAKDTGMLFHLDAAARFAAIRGAANYGIHQKIFINFLPNAIYDPRTCLQQTIAALDRSQLQRDQVVFEVVESDHISDTKHLRSILDFYRREGFEVALDDLGAGYSSLNLLHELKPDYVKLDMGLIQNVHRDRYKGLVVEKLIEIANLLDIKIIAEGIECQEDCEWLRQRQVDYMQGHYFAPPVAPPPVPTLRYRQTPPVAAPSCSYPHKGSVTSAPASVNSHGCF